MTKWVWPVSSALAVWLWATAAAACGVWALEDRLSESPVKFYVHTVSVRPPREKRRRTVLRIVDATANTDPMKLPDTPALLDSVRTQDGRYTFAGSELRCPGRVIAQLEREQLTLGERAYRIAMKPLVEDYHGMPMWGVEVTVGEQVVLEGKATHLCGGDGVQMIAINERMELTRRRIAIYLAWRQLEGEAPAK